MILLKYPEFKKGRILKKEMLEELRDYPREMFEIYFSDYSDGIIVGFEIKVKDEELIISPGILKINKGILYLKKEEKISYEKTNKEMQIKLVLEEKTEDKDYGYLNGEVVIEELKEKSKNKDEIKERDENKNEIELGRYKLREGALLRDSYENLMDYSVEYNMLNIINVKYSTISGNSLKKEILDKFGDVLVRKGEQSIDISFGMNILNGKEVSRKAINVYLERKLKKKIDELENIDIYNHLLKISKNIGKEERVEKTGRRRATRIIVE
ncbi:hypothetical protein [Haliovirga abyssi]|uniref:R3H domain-containing protein n=1 Tax=Haliovirga abyssi TaxID=2996794 RepID=A0AAU9D3S3_9FUSO|nr:hypothetical protein [Haliovirga abyssi]BDU50621.1 hypothetical protein HLVA_11900 [Haliovirga abyssi]